MPTDAAKAREKKKVIDSDVVAECEDAAEDAGLRYVTDDQPGYTRRRNGKGFAYFDTAGKRIKDEKRILRLNRLAIPPAYKDVWICPSPNGHLQATGLDARGRKQYRYHAKWREARDETKYDRLITFGAALPKIRLRVKQDLARHGLPREKVLAAIVAIMERTFIRVGNEEYARENNSYGLTTMRNNHVKVKGTKVRFKFRGKSGVMHEVDLSDRRLGQVVKDVQELPGQELFGYLDDDGEVRDVKSQDVNDYLQEIVGEDFTAKDFRTWAGTVLAAVALHAVEAAETETAAKANVKTAVTAVAKLLGNTPAVCRKCYIHPGILDAYLAGEAIEGLNGKSNGVKRRSLRSVEKAVIKFLRRQLKKA